MTRRRPLMPEPEQHYWRRRANRRVRKRRLTRNLSQWSLVLAVNALIAAALIYGAGRGLSVLTASPEFSLERIERNLLEIDLAEVGRVAAGDPWVLDASVKRVLPDTVRISLRERSPGALAIIGGVAHLVDGSGFVIGPSGSASADDLPVLTGLDGFRDAALTAALRRGVGLVERLRREAPQLADEISELDLSRQDRLPLRTVHPGPLLLLDPRQVERNVNPYLRLRHEIERRSGALAYVDLRWADRISVMPVFDSSVRRNR